MENIVVRLAEDRDCRVIFEWRNDEHTRNMSNGIDTIEWEEHQKWFANSLNSQSRLILVCEKAFEGPIATVRFDIGGSNAVVSINLCPTMRGKGLATLCLRSSINFFSKRRPTVHKLTAKVKEMNIASRKVFSAAGFTKEKLEKDLGTYTKDLR